MRQMSDKGGFIDRSKEKLIFNRITSLGQGPKNLGEELMGQSQVRLEEFLDGRHPSMTEYLQPNFRRALANCMIRFHRLEFPELPQQPPLLQLEDLISNFYDRLETIGTLSPRHLETVMELKEAVQKEKDIIPFLHSLPKDSVTFCHNDLNRLNILCGTKPGDSIDLLQLKLIDYEYGEYNFLGFEIANYFNESCFDLTLKTYPFYSHTDDSANWDDQVADFAFYYKAFRFIETKGLVFSEEDLRQSFQSQTYLKERLEASFSDSCEQTAFLEQVESL